MLKEEFYPAYLELNNSEKFAYSIGYQKAIYEFKDKINDLLLDHDLNIALNILVDFINPVFTELNDRIK